jgi:hypothetical protein
MTTPEGLTLYTVEITARVHVLARSPEHAETVARGNRGFIATDEECDIDVSETDVPLPYWDAESRPYWDAHENRKAGDPPTMIEIMGVSAYPEETP